MSTAQPGEGASRDFGGTVLSVDEQMKVITSGVSQIVPEEELREKLRRGKPLNIKLGVDPTSPDLHLGHAVPLRKMRQFQDLGHNVTLIIGNGTALIGDPSGRDSTRPPLTEEQVEANAETYVAQAMKVLDPEKTTIVHNGDWIKPLNLGEMLGLMSKFNVARILEREDFHNRYTSGLSIALHEFIYPVLQAYDSVVVKADVEMGGNDQIFNLLAGRDLMRDMGLTDEPADMFGKVMSIADEIVPMYYRLCSTKTIEEIEAIDAAFADGSADPYKLKRELGVNIVDLYHGAGAGQKALEAFDAQFKKGEVPENVPEFPASVVEANDEGLVYIGKLLVDLGIASTASEARRLVDGGGVKVNGEALAPKRYNVDPTPFVPGAVVQSGKRRWARLV